MNIITEYEVALGGADTAARNQDFKDFQQLYLKMSKKLKVRKYLLDEYLYNFLRTPKTITISGELLKYGSSLESSLLRGFYELISDAVGGRDELNRMNLIIRRIVLTARP